jgi:ATP-binding cassette subfamily C protein LapB
MGIYYKNQVERLTASATAAANRKTGLLVETIEGAETIKSGQSGWRMLTRWVNTVDEARGYESKMRRSTEHSQYVMGLLQQLSYVILVATGALLVSSGHLTMGSLIACSILSGRILAPVGAIPAQLVQWGNTKAALQSLDKIWALEDDHGNENPIQVKTIQGGYLLEGIKTLYAGNQALSVERLQILPGQKIGILGPIGAGKTTLLRLLSGMYKPQAGRVLLDGLDISQIHKPGLAENIGYLQQEGRLFAGTLRENLLLGMLDPGDEIILQAAKQTGLYASVIASHSKGLLLEIFEGGTGLSGGQRQLVNLTRLFLRSPCIWLLDEPTASMDRALEVHIMSMFTKMLRPSDTFVLVTHKAEMLDLVDRIIVIANHQIVLDGPKADVLAQLQRAALTPPATMKS